MGAAIEKEILARTKKRDKNRNRIFINEWKKQAKLGKFDKMDDLSSAVVLKQFTDQSLDLLSTPRTREKRTEELREGIAKLKKDRAELVAARDEMRRRLLLAEKQLDQYTRVVEGDDVERTSNSVFRVLDDMDTL